MTFHNLKHTFVTRLAERGVHEIVIMALLGNSSLWMTTRYAHATPEVVRAAMGAIEHRLADLLELRRKIG